MNKRIDYNKENWEDVNIKKIKEHLKNHDKLDYLLKHKIVGFTNDEFIQIQNRVEKGRRLIEQVLKDKLEGIF